MATSSSFFSYTDAQGVDVIVQRLADVPEQYRAPRSSTSICPKPAITLRPGSGERAQTPPAALHVPSFVLGAGTGAGARMREPWSSSAAPTAFWRWSLAWSSLLRWALAT